MIKRTMMAGLALVLLAGPAMAQAKEPELVTNDRGLTDSVMTMRVRGDLTFGPDGVVKEHHIVTKLDPKMIEYVDKTIGKWKFKPVTQDGKPVNAKSYFQATLAARAQGADSYELAVDNVRFSDKQFLTQQELDGQAKDSQKCLKDCIASEPVVRPRYPVGLMQAGVSGAVMVHLYLNSDGSVADAIVAQSSLYNIRGGDKTLDDARKLLEKDVLRYARQLRMAPGSGSPLVGDSHLIGALPVVFRMEGVEIDNEGAWRLEQRSRRNIASWLVSDPDRWIGVSDAAGNGFVAMNNNSYKLVPSDGKAP